jgi:hypothetical protein
MTDLVEVPLGGGQEGTITFAAAGSRGPRAYSGAQPPQMGQDSFEKALDSVRLLADVMVRKLADLEFSSAEASFGISFTGKGKFIVAEASAQASVTVKIAFKGKAP